MKKITQTDYIKTYGMSLEDCLAGPVLDHLIPFKFHVYDMKTNQSVVDKQEIRYDSKYLSRRVFAFSYEEKDGERIVTFDLEKVDH